MSVGDWLGQEIPNPQATADQSIGGFFIGTPALVDEQQQNGVSMIHALNDSDCRWETESMMSCADDDYDRRRPPCHKSSSRRGISVSGRLGGLLGRGRTRSSRAVSSVDNSFESSAGGHSPVGGQWFT